MKVPQSVEPLLEPLAALQHLLRRFNERGVIMGGVAASLLGKPRYTVDLEAMFLLSVDDIPHLIEVARTEGIEPRIPSAADFARKHRVLLLRHTASDTNIDISLGILPFEEEVVARSVVHPIASLSIRLPTPEDLIILKAVAKRPKDLQDIQAIVDKHPDLDTLRIEKWVKEFAAALEMPALWDDIAGFFDKP